MLIRRRFRIWISKEFLPVNEVRRAYYHKWEERIDPGKSFGSCPHECRPIFWNRIFFIRIRERLHLWGSSIGFSGFRISLIFKLGIRDLKAKSEWVSGLKVCLGGGMPNITLAITGLHEILGRDYGIEEPYWGPTLVSCRRRPIRVDLHGKTGNSGWKVKWLAPFRL